MSTETDSKGPTPPEWASMIALTMSSLKEATAKHPRMSVFTAVLALALVGVVIRVTYGFSAFEAVTYMGIAIAAAHVLRGWLGNDTATRGSDWLGRLMTWALSLLLLACAATMLVSKVVCQVGYFCPAPPPPSQRITISSFDLLDERQVDTSKADHRFERLNKVTRNTVARGPDASPLVALVGTVDGYARRPDGSIGVRLQLYAGVDQNSLSLQDTYELDGSEKWKSAGMVARYKNSGGATGAPGVIADLRAQGTDVRDDTLVALSTLTCLSKEIVENKAAFIRLVAFDDVSGTFSESRLISVIFVEKLSFANKGCSLA